MTVLRAKRFRSERGSITAEFATVLPAALVVVLAVLAGFTVLGQQMRIADAASIAARLLGRADDEGAADAVATLAGPGAVLATTVEGRFVCATVTTTSEFGPAGLASIDVSSRTCSLSAGE